MIFTETKILVHFYKKNPGHHHHFPRLSMTLAAFHDFPGLENGLTKFHDFPGRVVTLHLTACCQFRRGDAHRYRGQDAPHYKLSLPSHRELHTDQTASTPRQSLCPACINGSLNPALQLHLHLLPPDVPKDKLQLGCSGGEQCPINMRGRSAPLNVHHPSIKLTR